MCVITFDTTAFVTAIDTAAKVVDRFAAKLKKRAPVPTDPTTFRRLVTKRMRMACRKAAV